MAAFSPHDLADRNRRVMTMAAMIALGSLCLGFAAVPLYRVFCQVTGFNGTTQRASAAVETRAVAGRTMSIRFDSNVAPGMPDATQIDALSPAQVAALGSDITGLSTAALDSIDAAQAGGITQSQYFDLWNAENSTPLGGGDTRLQHLSTEMLQVHATTSADGTASGTNALSQYVNQVTGTDIVSDAEFDAGFTITGKAAAGAEGTIKFFLDNNRINGINEVGTQLQNGVNGVTIAYDNATGNYTLSFAAGSAALLQATHNTYGSGIHQLTVDTDGNGAKNSSEASRLFLVADGTAQNTDTGTVAQNYSVQDRVTGDVFVYYYGDPDGNGVGMWTKLDSGDTASNVTAVTTDRDLDGNGWGDSDYYNTTSVVTGTETTVANTALGVVSNIAAQTLQRRITQGEFPTGSALPSQRELSEQLSISRARPSQAAAKIRNSASSRFGRCKSAGRRISK